MEAVENVVRLAEFRRKKASAQRAAASQEPGSQYFCLRCEAEEFRLYASGTIHCAKCGALIRNIHVDSSPRTAGE
jgi:DNA-directed RNA polymerase subunit RPC12/RpoP